MVGHIVTQELNHRVKRDISTKCRKVHRQPNERASQLSDKTLSDGCSSELSQFYTFMSKKSDRSPACSTTRRIEYNFGSI
ncbi:unnamed protein product [Macrosiphum euphorbiae]|uniref:Uncharacterized protein n=1 Tax=Macrosiphum euphorbiae TaxID=13131 RepID=A0AAV0VQ23_9HEMI|nr:unnamed protein product [Macrosiphum euphorbiae]